MIVDMKIVRMLYFIGAVMLLLGAVARLFIPEYYAYIYIIGAVLFSITQFLLRPRNCSVALRRLVVQQQIAGILFVAAGVLMFTHIRNEWMVILTCGALIELYTAYRIPQELDKR